MNVRRAAFSIAGTALLLAACAGPKAAVPDVVNRNPTEAKRILEAAGFRVEVNNCNPDQASNPVATPFVSHVKSGDRTLYSYQPPTFDRPAAQASAPAGSAIHLDIGHHLITTSLQCSTFGSAPSRNWVGLVFFFLWLAQIALAFVAAFDMRSRGERGWLWGLLVWFTSIIGIVIWLVMRRNLPVVDRRPIPGTEYEAWGSTEDRFRRPD